MAIIKGDKNMDLFNLNLANSNLYRKNNFNYDIQILNGNSENDVTRNFDSVIQDRMIFAKKHI